MNERPMLLGLVCVASWLACSVGLNAAIVTEGLLVDLDADAGVTADGEDVDEWENQVTDNGMESVVTNSDFPPVLVDGPNGHKAIELFDGARMANEDEDAVDSIMLGDGHTWFAVIAPAEVQNSPAKNAIFGTLTKRQSVDWPRRSRWSR